MKSKLKVLIPLVATAILASCSGSGSQSTGASTTGYITTPVTIEFEHTSSYSNYIDSYIEAFKEVEPNVTVTNTKTSGSYDTLASNIIQGIPANDYPDLFLGYPDAVMEMINAGVGVRLDTDDYMNNSEYGFTESDNNDIIATYMEEGKSYPVEGVYSLPFAKSTEAMYYNHDALIGLNLSAIDPTINDGNSLTETYINNLTWEELFDKLCPAIVAYNETLPDTEKILQESSEYNTMVVGYASDDNLFITLAEQYGYDYTGLDQSTGTGQILFNNDNMKSLMKTFNKAKNNGYLLTQGTNDDTYTNYSLVNGCSLFDIASTGGVKYQQTDDFVTGVAPLPHAEGHDRKVINQGPSIAILNHKDANRTLATYLFAKFLINETNSKDWAINTGYSPIRYSTLESADWTTYSTEGSTLESLSSLKARVAKYTATSAYVGNALFASPVFKGSSEARTQAGSIVTQVLSLSTEACTDSAVDAIFETAYQNVLKEM